MDSSVIMSHSIPPNSSSPQGSSRNDEWIAVLVALLAMGGILFWLLGRDAKPDRQKFASPAAIPAPEVGASDSLRFSKALEDSFAQYRGREVPEPVVLPRGDSAFERFSFGEPDAAIDSDSTVMSPAAGFTPFFFAPEDREVTIAPMPTADSTAAQGDTEVTIAPIPIRGQTAQPEAEATPQPETETAAQPETVATPQPEAEATPQPDTATPAPVPLALSDVPEDYWAREFIEYTAQEQIVIPYANGIFRPEQPVTRAEFAAQVENAFVPEESKAGKPSYEDVTSSYWAEQAIVDVTETGFMTGYPGEVFNPNLAMPRVQVLVALASGLNLEPPENPEEVLQEAYRDADQIPQWAVPLVAAATESGLVVSYPETNTLNPNQPATRAEVSAIIYQALVESDKAEPISSDYIVKPDK